MKPRKLTGQKFNRLTVVCEIERLKPKIRRFRCVCDCGNLKEIAMGNLTSGAVKSCGCLKKDGSKVNGLKGALIHGFKHGGWNSGAWRSWSSMIHRCNDPKKKYYFGKVKVCPRWLKFEKFLADMGERPAGATIDRIDPAGNYCPENCRWSSSKIQARNRSSNLKITFNGETKTLVEWSEQTGILADTILKRIVNRKWSVSDALTVSPKSYHGNREQFLREGGTKEMILADLKTKIFTRK